MNRLKELRKAKNITQKDLANEIGVATMSILRWENGEHQIKPDKAQKLANFFGVPVGYLLGFENVPFENTIDYLKDKAFWGDVPPKIDPEELKAETDKAQNLLEIAEKVPKLSAIDIQVVRQVVVSLYEKVAKDSTDRDTR